jgi:hypothetical protein
MLISVTSIIIKHKYVQREQNKTERIYTYMLENF